jgi:hypothetical protein
MLEGLGSAIGAMLITAATVLVGGIFALVAWGRILYERARHGRWEVPMALYAFTASIFLEPLWTVVNDHLSYQMLDYQVLGIRLPALSAFCFVSIGVGLLLIGSFALRYDTAPTKRTVLAGTITLGIFYVLGIVLMV